jgi:hypothetical protein
VAPQEEKKRGRSLFSVQNQMSIGKKKKKKEKSKGSSWFQVETLRSTKIQRSDLQSVFRNVILALGSTFLPIVLK